MASLIAHTTEVLDSLLDKSLSLLPLDSKKILRWKCKKCGGVWRESVVKRAKFTLCPECEPNKVRLSIVMFEESKEVVPVIKRIRPTEKRDCIICCSEQKTFVKCGLCDYECCAECLKTYILGSNNDFICMNNECRKPIPQKTLLSVYTKKWLKDKKNGYFAHLDRVYVEEERAKIPQTLPQVEIERKRMKLDEDMNNIRTLFRDGVITEDKYKELEAEIFKLYREINLIQPSEVYIQNCPVDGCRGLIKDDYTCPICDVHICNQCREPLKPDHKCNPDTIKTINSMKRNTKACPKCAALIFKIDGCDQMFCTKCHTAFSWKTGMIETGHIHNPHYFQYLRDTHGYIPRNPGDVQDGVCPDFPDVRTFMTSNCHVGVLTTNEISMRDRIIRMVYNPQMFVLQNNIAITERDLDNSRISYLLGLVTEKTWHEMIFKAKRELKIARSMYEIIGGLRTVLSPLITTLTLDHSRLAWDTFFSQAEKIREYFNECIYNELCMYEDSIDLISSEWFMINYQRVRNGYTR